MVNPGKIDNTRKTIQKDKLLLVEGKDELYFFIQALKAWRRENEIQVLEYSGKNNLNNYLEALPGLPNFEIARTIVIVRDSDDSASDAIRSMSGALSANGFPAAEGPFKFIEKGQHKTAYMVVPGYDENGEFEEGRLENLCLKAINDEHILNCVDQYLECVEKHGERLTRPWKNRFYTYLSGKSL